METSVEESFDESKEDVEMKDVSTNEETPIEVTVVEDGEENVKEEVKEELKEEEKVEEKKEDEEKKEETEEDPDIIMEKVVDPSENKCVQAEIVLDDDDDEEQTAEGDEDAEKKKPDTKEEAQEEIDFTKVKIKEEPVDPDEMHFTESISKTDLVDEIIAPGMYIFNLGSLISIKLVKFIIKKYTLLNTHSLSCLIIIVIMSFC